LGATAGAHKYKNDSCVATHENYEAQTLPNAKIKVFLP